MFASSFATRTLPPQEASSGQRCTTALPTPSQRLFQFAAKFAALPAEWEQANGCIRTVSAEPFLIYTLAELCFPFPARSRPAAARRNSEGSPWDPSFLSFTGLILPLLHPWRGGGGLGRQPRKAQGDRTETVFRSRYHLVFLHLKRTVLSCNTYG